MKGITRKSPFAIVGNILLLLGLILGAAIAEADGPSISISPTEGPVNTQITVVGTGFATDTVVSISYGGSDVLTDTTNSGGAFTSTITATLPAGGYGAVNIEADDGIAPTSTLFTLLGPPTIALDTPSGPVNTPITVTGEDFAATDTVTITFDGNPVATDTTDGNGGFSTTFNAPAPTDPADPGQYGLVDIGVSDSSTGTTTTPFTLNGPPSISIDVDEGVAGTTITVTGEDFAATSTVVTISYTTAVTTTEVATANTDANGDFVVSFDVPTPTDSAELGDGNTVSAEDDKGLSATADDTFNLIGVINEDSGEYAGTIQAAIDAAATDTKQTLTVGPGTYGENIDIDRAVTLTSRDGSGDTTIAGAATDSPVVLISDDDVTLGNGGFTIKNDSGVTGTLVHINAAVSGTTVQNNMFGATFVSYGIKVAANGLTDASVSVQINNNDIASASIAGILVDAGNTTATISNNFVTNNELGVKLGLGVSATVNDNDLGNNTAGAFSSDSAETIDASGNWWGSNTEAGVLAAASGVLDVTPFLDNDTDTDGAAGFQGDFSTLHVTSLGEQTGGTGRVQEGVDLVTASTVIVGDGLYQEAVAINKPLTLKSINGSGSTTIDSTGVAGGATIDVSASDVTIGGSGVGFTLTDETIGVQVANGESFTAINNAVNAGGTGFAISNSAGSTVSGNIISVNSTTNGTGITLSDSASSGVNGNNINVAADGNALGISVTDSSATAAQNNTVTVSGGAGATGISFDPSPSAVISGASVSVTSGGDGVGVSATDSDSASISGMDVTVSANVDGTGVDVSNSGSTTVDDTQITVAADGDGTGVSIVSSTGAEVTQSSVTVNAGQNGWGVNIADSASAVVINVDLTVGAGQDGWGVQDSTSDDSTISGNIISVNATGDGAGVSLSDSASSGVNGNNINVAADGNALGIGVTDSSATAAQNNTVTVSGGTGATGISFDPSPGAVISGGSVDVGTGGIGAGVSVAESEDSSISGIDVSVDSALTGTGVSVSDSPSTSVHDLQADVNSGLNAYGARVTFSGGSAVANSTFVVSAANNGWGVRAADSDDASVSGNSITVETQGNGTGVSLSDSASSGVHGNNINVGAGGEALGIGVTDSASTAAQDNIATVFGLTGATGISFDPSPGAAISGTTVDVATGGVGVGISIVTSGTATITDTIVVVEADGDGTGIWLEDSPGSTVANTGIFVDAGSLGNGIIVETSPDTIIVNNQRELGVVEHGGFHGVAVGASGPATGVRVVDSPNTQVVDSFFDVFSKVEATGIEFIESPDGLASGSEVSVESGESAVGGIAGDSPGTLFVDSFFDVFASFEGVGVALKRSSDGVVSGNEIHVDTAISAIGIRLDVSPNNDVFGNTLTVNAGGPMLLDDGPVDGPPDLEATGIRAMASGGVYISENTGEVRSPEHAWGILIDSVPGPPPLEPPPGLDADVIIGLTPLTKDDQTGVVALTDLALSETAVVLEATPGISELNHIHDGTCEAPGPVAFGLMPMVDGFSETVVPIGLGDLLAGEFVVMLHAIGDPAVFTACADLAALPAPDPGAGPFWAFVERNSLDVFGDSEAQGLVLTNAPESDIEGNTFNVHTRLNGDGILVIDSGDTTIAESVFGEDTQSNTVVVMAGDAFTDTLFSAELGGFDAGAGIVVDTSPGTMVAGGTSVFVDGPFDGVGILVLASDGVSVMDSSVGVLALAFATGVAAHESHGFSMNGSSVDAQSSQEAAGVWITDSDKAYIGPQTDELGEPIGPANSINAMSVPQGEEVLFNPRRQAAGVLLENSADSAIVGNGSDEPGTLDVQGGISATAEVLHDGFAFRARAGGVIGFDVPGLIVAGNTVNVDSGKELVAEKPFFDEGGPLSDIFDKIDDSAEGGDSGLTAARAVALGIRLQYADGAVVDSNTITSQASLKQPGKGEGFVDGIGRTFALGVGLFDGVDGEIINNSADVNAHTGVLLLAIKGEVESLASSVLNGQGVSRAFGIRARHVPDVVVAGNADVNVDAVTELDLSITATIGEPVTGTAATLSRLARLGREVALGSVEGRDVPVGALANNNFSNAEGLAEATGIEVHFAIHADVSNNVVNALADVTALASVESGGGFLADTEAFAVGNAFAVGIHLLGADLATVIGNQMGVQARGSLDSKAGAATPAPLPIAGPFALVDLMGSATGIAIEQSKKVVVAGNGVDVNSEGLVQAVGVEVIPVGPELAEGWAFGTADAFGIVASDVDRIHIGSWEIEDGGEVVPIPGNIVNVSASGDVSAGAAQVPLDFLSAEAAASGWSTTMGIGVQGSDQPVIVDNQVDVEGIVGLDVLAMNVLGGEAALAQVVVDSLGIGATNAFAPDINDNSVNVLASGELRPREEFGLEPIEAVRQCHIEVFATGIGVADAWLANIVGNDLGDPNEVTALANCQAVFGNDGGDVIAAQPLVVGVTTADAVGIGVFASSETLVAKNVVTVVGETAADIEAIAPEEIITPAVAAASSYNLATTTGIGVTSSPETRVVGNVVESLPGMQIVARAVTEPLSPAGKELSSHVLQQLVNVLGGDRVADLGGVASGVGIGIWDSTDSLVGSNDVFVWPTGEALGQTLEMDPSSGDAFTFGDTAASGFGVMVADISDGTQVVENTINVATENSLTGTAEAVTIEDPLVFGATLSNAVGIHNFDSFDTQIAGNEVTVDSTSSGGAFATENIVPLEANAIQSGLSFANAVEVVASEGVEVRGNTVQADSLTEAVAVAQEILTEAQGLAAGQAQALGIGVWPFLEIDAPRIDSLATDIPEEANGLVWGIQIVDNTVLTSTAEALTLAVAQGFETPALDVSLALARADGISATGVFDSLIKGNTVLGLDAFADPGALFGAGVSATEHPLDDSLAVANALTVDIDLIGSLGVLVNGNDLTAGGSDFGVKVQKSGLVRVAQNDIVGHGEGVRVHRSVFTSVRENRIAANGIGVHVVGGLGIFVNFNEIIGNEEGVLYSIVPPELDHAFHSGPLPWAPPVDATYNWWGDITGPSGIGSGSGDSVSWNVKLPPGGSPGGAGLGSSTVKVAYSPWLTAPAAETLADGVGHLGFERDWTLDAGWNTLATPIALDSGDGEPENNYRQLGNIITEVDNAEIAFRFDSATQSWVLIDANYELNPLDGVYVKMSGQSDARFIASTNLEGPHTRHVEKGWNLIGMALPLIQASIFGEADGDGEPLDAGVVPGPFPDSPTAEVFGRFTFFQPLPVLEGLVSLAVAGTVDAPGWLQVISPSPNVDSWVHTAFSPGNGPFMGPYEAYWVFMENPDDLAGFSFTPLELPPWASVDD